MRCGRSAGLEYTVTVSKTLKALPSYNALTAILVRFHFRVVGFPHVHNGCWRVAEKTSLNMISREDNELKAPFY